MRHLLCLVVFAGAVAKAAIPELEEGVYLKTNNAPLGVGSHSAPSVIDWNSDGRKDLLVGQFTLGYVWLFLNQGTDAQPVFGAGQRVNCAGTPITTSYG